MYRYVIEDTRHVPPFNEPASLLTIGTQPLKFYLEELIRDVFKGTMDLAGILNSRTDLQEVQGESVVYRNSLWFDKAFLEYFVHEARKTGKACRAAFPAADKAFHAYTIPLQKSFEPALNTDGKVIFKCDLWYFPDGYDEDIISIVVPSDANEIGFYSVPDFMTMTQGDLTHYAPQRAIISIESWVHVYFATIIFGNFGRAGRLDDLIEHSVFAQLKMLWHGILEQKQVLSSSAAMKIGKNCDIDPSAIITGPGKIGDNCSIGAGAIVDNCTIGDNVNIDAGCVLKMSTVADGCFLPFRTALYLTALMENTIIAQNTCLQMCVIGRNSFIGAGSTFTDFNLVAQKPIRAANIDGELQSVGQIVLGSAVGHNCRIGSGMVIFPGRMIESDVVLVASPGRRVLSRSVAFEESDHHIIRHGDIHKRFYPRIYEEDDIDDTWD
jgi:UDP-N-acetylglucosamine diphosphorylase / glucose-1-phosphate thymidylyltransferase / UDP-N-acetylgalactosamine diphosphorylase / glucosamine-1-phosphate N-acetyltransferase / galactosamine-1-phosphate N-acetyltransferase